MFPLNFTPIALLGSSNNRVYSVQHQDYANPLALKEIPILNNEQQKEVEDELRIVKYLIEHKHEKVTVC